MKLNSANAKQSFLNLRCSVLVSLLSEFFSRLLENDFKHKVLTLNPLRSESTVLPYLWLSTILSVKKPTVYVHPQGIQPWRTSTSFELFTAHVPPPFGWWLSGCYGSFSKEKPEAALVLHLMATQLSAGLVPRVAGMLIDRRFC